jgi:hypothetical protein
MKAKPSAKPYWEMNTEELAAATAEFDREFIADTFRPLTPEERKQWQRLKRKLGRPQRGAGAKVISLSVERTLLAKSDRLAKKLHLTRAALVDQALRALLKAQRTPRRRTGT